MQGIMSAIIKGRQDLEAIATAAARSKFYAGIDTPEKAMTIIMAGLEIGVPPVTALSNIHIIKGKPVLSGALIAAKVKQHPNYDYRKIETKDESACVSILQDGEEVGRETFTMTDAKRANVTGNFTWKQYPNAMLFWRALTQAARFHCPDVFMGSVYMPEEMGENMTEDGDFIRLENEPVIEHQEEAIAPPKRRDTISDKQAKLMFSKCDSAGVDKGELKKYLESKYNIESSTDIKKDDFDDILEWIDQNGKD